MKCESLCGVVLKLRLHDRSKMTHIFWYACRNTIFYDNQGLGKIPKYYHLRKPIVTVVIPFVNFAGDKLEFKKGKWTEKQKIPFCISYVWFKEYLVLTNFVCSTFLLI